LTLGPGQARGGWTAARNEYDRPHAFTGSGDRIELEAVLRVANIADARDMVRRGGVVVTAALPLLGAGVTLFGLASPKAQRAQDVEGARA
jgi:hypothetical protein